MATILDQVLVIDIESTCWPGQPPQGQLSEIIEIGICVVDLRQLVRLEKRSIMVKPVRSKVNEFCTKLTTITQDDVVNAGSLADAVSILKREYRSIDRVWASWGDYDRRQFEKVCKELTVPYPFGRSHLNIKTLLAMIRGDAKEMALDVAMNELGLTLEGTLHRGDDDAWNIADVFLHMLTKMRANLLMP